jgi:hypothetical protein
MIDLTGLFLIEHLYGGRMLHSCHIHNNITDEGKNRFLNIGFHRTPQITNWWLGLIAYSGFSSLSDTDTYPGINESNAWDEFTDYTDTNNGGSSITRPLWITNAASGQSITNTTKAIFHATVDNTIKGLFVVGGSSNAQNKGDNLPSNSILWATALFDTDYPVFNGSVLRISYAINT